MSMLPMSIPSSGVEVQTQIAVLQPREVKIGQGARPPVGASEGAVRMLHASTIEVWVRDPAGREQIDGVTVRRLGDPMLLFRSLREAAFRAA